MRGQQHLCATHLPKPVPYQCADLACLTDGGMAMCLDCQRDANLIGDEVAQPRGTFEEGKGKEIRE